MKAITDKEFEQEVIKSEVPVLLDFYADWCGPCKALMPILQEIEEEYKDKIKIVKMAVDENRETPEIFGVRTIPFLVFLKDGKTMETLNGLHHKKEVLNFIERNI